MLNAEGFHAAQNCTFKGGNVWLLRKCWGIPTVKINGTSTNPARWPDGTYSVQGAAAALGVTPQTIFKYLMRSVLEGRQMMKGQPWQIELTDKLIAILRARAQRNGGSRKKASCNHRRPGHDARSRRSSRPSRHHLRYVESYRRRSAMEAKHQRGRPASSRSAPEQLCRCLTKETGIFPRVFRLQPRQQFPARLPRPFFKPAT